MPTEADTCRKFVVPKLQAAGWDNEPYSIAEQRTITDGRIVPVGKSFIRRPPKRVDYLLRYRRDFLLAVVEAKPEYKTAADGLQQAKQYAAMLGLKFAYSSNGPDILEFDYFTGKETKISSYPTPENLWQRFRDGKSLTDDTQVQQLLTPINFALRQGERYYQEIAINRAVEAIVTGKRRVLLSYPEKILLLGAWFEARGGSVPWKSADMDEVFKQAKEKPPANFPRDVKQAIKAAWIHPMTPRTYSVTRTGWNKLAEVLSQ